MIFNCNTINETKCNDKIMIISDLDGYYSAGFKKFCDRLSSMPFPCKVINTVFDDKNIIIEKDMGDVLQYVSNCIKSKEYIAAIIYISKKHDVLFYHRLLNLVISNNNIFICCDNDMLENYYKKVSALLTDIVSNDMIFGKKICADPNILCKNIEELVSDQVRNKFVAIVTDDEQHAVKLLDSIKYKYLEKHPTIKVVTTCLQGYVIMENCCINDRLLVYINRNVFGKAVKKIKLNKSMVNDTRYASIRKIITVKIDSFNTISYCYIHPSTITDFSYVGKLFDKIYVDVMSNYKELKLPEIQLVEDKSLVTPYIRKNLYCLYKVIQSHIDMISDGNKAVINAYNEFENAWLTIQRNMIRYFFADALSFKHKTSPTIYDHIAFSDTLVEQHLLCEPIVADIDKKD